MAVCKYQQLPESRKFSWWFNTVSSNNLCIKTFYALKTVGFQCVYSCYSLAFGTDRLLVQVLVSLSNFHSEGMRRKLARSYSGMLEGFTKML